MRIHTRSDGTTQKEGNSAKRQLFPSSVVQSEAHSFLRSRTVVKRLSHRKEGTKQQPGEHHV